MLSTVLSATTIGIDGVLIRVEVDVAERGFPTFTIVGLPDKAVEESKERVRAAIKNSSFDMPESRITVNLAPADIPKEGSIFDLPIAIGILASARTIERDLLDRALFIGELSLDGKIRRTPGVLPITILAKENKIKSIFIPKENAREAALVTGVDIYSAELLTDLILHLNKEKFLIKQPKTIINQILKNEEYDFDFTDVNGQEQAKRALEIAASGFHNVHLKGPPGAGKTMLARSLPSIMPKMDEQEIIEVSKIYSVSQVCVGPSFIIKRPFRSPHHTTSRAGLIGGGTKVNPGEISLAHRGVLFLDELPEFPRSVLEALRQPLEDGIVTVSRAQGSLTFPARFLFLSASNPCPCGFLGHPKKACRCSLTQVMRYKKRISGPLMDRIDIHVDVPPVEEEKLTSGFICQQSALIRERVIKARERQKKRLKKEQIKTNGEMSSSQVRQLCKLTNEANTLLKQAISHLSLSARAYFKIIKIAQTIADLSEKESIKAQFIAEALQYRVKEE
jgi:magnesium chelatase family protein